jgi:hypothetical protein
MVQAYRNNKKSSLCVCGTILVLTSFEQWQTEGGGSMRKLLMCAAALHFAVGVTIAQPAATPGNQTAIPRSTKQN